MYDTFFKQLMPVEVENLDELRGILENRPPYTTETVDPSSIFLGDDGLINYNGKKSQMSLEGFKNMVVTMHRIPDPFAKRIPMDLLQYNIIELGKTINYPIQFVFNDEGLIVNAVKEELRVIPSLPLIRLFENHEVKKIIHSDYGTQIQTINPSFGNKFEPKKGDITGIGVNFVNSETGFWDPGAETLIWQLVCSNGAIMSRRFGKVKMRIKRPGINEDSVARTFQYKLEHMLSNFGLITERMNTMTDRNLTVQNAAWIFKASSKAVGLDEVCEHFQIDKEDYKDLRAKARLEEHKDEETEYNVHEIYSKVTNLANNYNNPIRRKLQVLGGKMFELDILGGRTN